MLPTGPAYGEEDDEAEPTLLTVRKSEKTTECVAAPSSEHQAEAGGRQDSPQQNDFKQEEDVEDPQLLNQERNLILVKVERVPSQIKEEQEELCISQEGEQFGLKQETERFNEDLPQQHECKQEEVLADQQLWNQERNNHLDQEEPEPLQVKEQQDEVSTNQEGVPLVQKQEPDTFMVTSTYEENEHREAEPDDTPQHQDFKEEKVLIVQERNSSLDQEKPDPTGIKEEDPFSSQEEEHFRLKQETGTFMVAPNVDSKNRESEPKSEQLLSHSSPDTESKDQGAGKDVNPGSTKPEEPESKRLCRDKSHTNNVNSSLMPENQCDTDTNEKFPTAK
ncbi:uncharacterized protein KZ484_008865 [Pholidichthys leucotaenia]